LIGDGGLGAFSFDFFDPPVLEDALSWSFFVRAVILDRFGLRGVNGERWIERWGF
jgi:hypothetical protein